MVNARQIAFEALLKTEKFDAYSNITLDAYISKYNIDTRDKAFVSALFYGIIERKLTIDYQLSKYLSKPIKKLKPEVLVVMEIGAYQILFMDKVPDSAAVNESVKLARKNGCSFASGLINAVLRKISSEGLILPDESKRTEYLSVKYSCPEEYIDVWMNELGEEKTLRFLESSLGIPGVSIRVNTLKTSTDELIDIFRKEGIEADKCCVPDALLVRLNANSIEKLDSYRNGLFHVQDLSCQICVGALSVQNNQRIFDMCSAPGGKAFTVAETIGNIGEVLCFDLHPSRVELIKKGAERLGLTCIKGMVGDTTIFNSEIGFADAVLCDVPCSGLGIIRRKPEIKYKSLESLSDLPEIQYKILVNASKYVKKGGTLLYSTCTVLNRENIDVCKRFLKEHTEFYTVRPDCVECESDFITLLPGSDFSGDGFFICVFKKKRMIK